MTVQVTRNDRTTEEHPGDSFHVDALGHLFVTKWNGASDMNVATFIPGTWITAVVTEAK